MKKRFISIGMKTFIPTNGIKFIIDSEAKVASRIIKEVQLEEEANGVRKIFNSVPGKSKRLSVILMNNDDVHYSRLRPQTIAERALLAGTEFIKVGTGLYLSVNNIKGVFRFDSVVATNIRREAEETKIANNISLVRKTKRRKTTLIMEDGTVVSVAIEPQKLLEDFIANKKDFNEE